MPKHTPILKILAQNRQKDEKCKKVNSEGIRKIYILDFTYVSISLHMILNAEAKKFPKNRWADGLFGLAVKWAEMAADHEN